MDEAHRERQHDGPREREAHHARVIDADRRARQRADQIAGVVGRCEPAAVTDIERAAFEHQRKQRREGESPDAERHREHDGARERGISRVMSGQRRCLSGRCHSR
jgi:hypothetical protein